VSRRIGILGGGLMATGLATLFTDAGHDVVISRRTPRRNDDDPAEVTSFAQAADHGDIVVLAITHAGVPAVTESLAHRLDGKVVIDITNSVVFKEGRLKSGLPDGISEGEWMANLLPNARVTRAYNHIQDEMLVSRARRQPGIWGVAVAGDDAQAVEVTRELVGSTGFVPVNVGSLRASLVLDPGGPVFPHMFTPVDLADVLQSGAPPRLPANEIS